MDRGATDVESGYTRCGGLAIGVTDIVEKVDQLIDTERLSGSGRTREEDVPFGEEVKEELFL